MVCVLYRNFATVPYFSRSEKGQKNRKMSGGNRIVPILVLGTRLYILGILLKLKYFRLDIIIFLYVVMVQRNARNLKDVLPR